MLTFIKANSESDFQIIENLARIIFHEVYSPIIPESHISFYLNNYQTAFAIKEQVNNSDILYYLITNSNIPVGYFGLEFAKKRITIGKLYLLESSRGKKFGEKAIVFIEDVARIKKIKTIDLVVNKNNVKSIKFYKKAGFKGIKMIYNTFSNGYTMEDFQMKKNL